MTSNLHFNPYKKEDPREKILRECHQSFKKLPWSEMRRNSYDTMLTSVSLAISVCMTPNLPGSLRERLTKVCDWVPSSSLEHKFFNAVVKTHYDLYMDPSIGHHSKIMMASAPLWFGGLAWVKSESLTKLARLSFCYYFLDAIAARIFYTSKASEMISISVLECCLNVFNKASSFQWEDETMIQSMYNEPSVGLDQRIYKVDVAIKEWLAREEKKILCGYIGADDISKKKEWL